MYHKNTETGFIALMSSIIISIILLAMVFAVSTSSFYARFDALGRESKRASLGLAESCMNIALLRLSEEATYQPVPSGDRVVIGNDYCTIVAVTPLSGVYPKSVEIKTKGEHHGAFSHILVNITMQNPNTRPQIIPAPPTIAIDSWQEVSTP